MGVRSIRLSHRRQRRRSGAAGIAAAQAAATGQAAGLDEVVFRGTNRVAVNALGGDALATAAFDRVVDPEHDRAARGKGGDQQAKQQAGRQTGLPDGAVEDAMVVGEPPLAAEAGDPQQAGHGALAGGENGANQQQLGMAPGSLLQEHRGEG
jgi:hypothetical protein